MKIFFISILLITVMITGCAQNNKQWNGKHFAVALTYDERTFAYTCGDYEAEGSSFKDFIGEHFIGARDVVSELNYLSNTELTSIHCFPRNGETGNQLIDIVNHGMEEGALVVFLFHGVGGEHNLNVELKAYHELLQYLNSIDNDVWVAPLVNVANYIKSNRLSNE